MAVLQHTSCVLGLLSGGVRYPSECQERTQRAVLLLFSKIILLQDILELHSVGPHSRTRTGLQRILIKCVRWGLCGRTQFGGNNKIHLWKDKTDTSASPRSAVGEKPEHCCCRKEVLLGWFFSWMVKKIPNLRQTREKCFIITSCSYYLVHKGRARKHWGGWVVFFLFEKM